MAEYLGILNLLAHGRPADWPVARRNGIVLTYADFTQRVADWQITLQAQAGQNFALYHPDTFEAAAVIFAAWHAGKTIWLPGDAQSGTLAQLAPQVDGFIGTAPAGSPCLQAAYAYAHPAWAPLESQACLLVVFTSGSTGAPAIIRKRLEQLDSELLAQQTLWGALWGQNCIIQATVSHQHLYGLLCRLLLPLCCGQVFAAQNLAFAEDMLQALAEAPTIMISSPAHLKRLPEGLPWSSGRANLRAIYSSGGPLPPEAVADCRNLLGQAPLEIYGSSETGGIAWRQRQTDHEQTWHCLPGVHVRVEADGLLAVRSPHLAETDWWRTADRGEPDGNSFVLAGRADRIVKIEEKRVSLTALETALQACEWLAEVRVIVLESASRQTLAVVAVPTAAGWAVLAQENRRGLNQKLRTILAQHVENSILPRRWRYVAQLPQNMMGKTVQQGLVALFAPARPPVLYSEIAGPTALYRIEVLESNPYFEGHFPGLPILAGVAQLEWIIRFAEEAGLIPGSHQFQALENAKFHQEIRPNMVLELTLEWQLDTERLHYQISSTQGRHASGRIVFAEAH